MDRAEGLVLRLRIAADALVAVIETVDDDRWNRVPGPDEWSIGKDAEHVADAAVYHQWIVRLTVGERVGSRRPAIERKVPTTALVQAEAIALIRRRSDDGAMLIGGLSDAHLDLPTRPPRAKDERLATTIERVLIGHYGAHQAAIEAKIRGR